MARTSFSDMKCSVARTLDVVGERWTPLIVRDILLGVRRFDSIQRDLGISRKVLAERLAELADHGVVERVPYQDNPPRHDYVLTQKGVELAYVLLAMKAWGDRWACDSDGPPLVLRHEACGEIVELVSACSACGERVSLTDVTPILGPGAQAGPGTSEVVAALGGVRAAEPA